MRSIAVQAPEDFLARNILPGTRPQCWPLDAPHVAPGPAPASAAELAADLAVGQSVMARLPAHWPDAELTRATWNLVTLMMRPSPQYDTGDLVCSVEVRADTTGPSHYSASSAAGGLHTDGTLLGRPPDYGVLLCLSEADQGGETVLVAAEDIRRFLQETDPGLCELLAAPQPFAAEDDDPGTVRQWHSVLSGPPGQTRMRYLRRYIQAGWQRAGRPAPDWVESALEAIDHGAGDPAIQRLCALRRGDVLIWCNSRFIHGRREFVELGRKRRLVRIYGEDDDARPAAVPATARSAGAVP